MAVTSSVEPLEGNKVRLHVAVPAGDFEQAIDAAFRKLALEVRIAGFRPGKAPRRLLEARFGTEIAREQALRDSLPDYYAEAVTAEALDAIAPPEIDITSGTEDGDIEFDAVVEVRPVVDLHGYEGLIVTIDGVEVTDAAVDAQIDQLRSRFADLVESGAPLHDGDFAEIDIKAYVHDEVIEGLTANDFLYEVGSGIVVPKLDEELRGKRPGDILKFLDALPERFGERAGDEVGFQVLVKDVKKKVLPEATDAWVADVTEHETLDAFRADVRLRLGIYARVQASMDVREKVFDAIADLVTIEVPDTLVEQAMERRLHDLAHRLEEQRAGLTIPEFLAATGQDQAAFLAGLREASTRAVKADLALRAVTAQEGIAVGDDAVDAELSRLAEDTKQKLADVRRDFERRGLLEAVRSDLARAAALQFLIDHAEVVDGDGNPVDLALTGEAAPQERSDTEEEEPGDTGEPMEQPATGKPGEKEHES